MAPKNAAAGQPSDAVLEREARIVELRRAGLSFQEIGDEVGIRDRGSVGHIYRRALARVVAPEVKELRQTEGDRLDRLQSAIWAKAMRGDLRAQEQVLRVMRRRARLFGLDHADKLAEQLVAVEEAKARMLAMALGKALDAIAAEVGMTEEQRDRATRVIFAELRVAEAAEQNGADVVDQADVDTEPEETA